MCTITYLPHDGGYILTQNRDESPLRAEAVFPVSEQIGSNAIIYPKDPEGSGSWFVSTHNGTTLCVLNGAYHPDKKPGAYKHSRGLIPLHYLDFTDVKAFVDAYHYHELEAFTLLVCTATGVTELCWNEETMQVKNHPPHHLIFQSAPLYNSEQQLFRQQLFTQFLKNNDAASILNFHTKPQTDDPALDIRMFRQQVKSVSTIQRVYGASGNHVSYMALKDAELRTVHF